MKAPDLEALLVALVLAPATYSRNRFFSLYTDPEVRRVRRRATLIRGVVRHIAGASREAPTLEPAGADRVALTYAVPAIGLRRTTTLDPLELALVRFALARAPEQPAPPALALDDPDRLRIESALVRLSPMISPSTPPV